MGYKSILKTLDKSLQRKIKVAILLLKELEPAEGYYVAFSGGKDSCVIKTLCDLAKVKYDAHYCVSGIDPPELVRFIKKEHPNVVWERFAKPFLVEIRTRGFPLRNARWCCASYKEAGGYGRVVILGVRKEESFKREKYDIISLSNTKSQKGKILFSPILDWNEADVWEFLEAFKVPYCSLYDEGWSRLGCIGCPLISEGQRKKEFERWPKFKAAFQKSFKVLYLNRLAQGKESITRWSTGEEMFEWWISGKTAPSTLKQAQEKRKKRKKKSIR